MLCCYFFGKFSFALLLYGGGGRHVTEDRQEVRASDGRQRWNIPKKVRRHSRSLQTITQGGQRCFMDTRLPVLVPYWLKLLS